MTQNRKTILNNRKAVSKAKTAVHRAARKGKQYLRDTTMVEAMSFAEEKPLLALRAYDVVIFPDGGYAVEQDFGHTVLMESIPEVTAIFDNDYYGCYAYERGAFYAHCYAFDEEHAKEICAPKLRELIKKEVEHQREQVAFAEFQAANLPELLGLA